MTKPIINHKERDYKKYAYFSSKAFNYGLLFKPCVEEILAGGIRRIATDDDGKKLDGFRIQFQNYGYRIDMNPMVEGAENKVDVKVKAFNLSLLKFLRAKVGVESVKPKDKIMVMEDHMPIKQIPENKVNEMLAAKDAEIKALKKANESKVEEPKKETEINKNTESKKEGNDPF